VSIDNCVSCYPAYSLVEESAVKICRDICGDGTRVENECDDGNLDSGDGCSDLCEEEENWRCYGGNEKQADYCSDPRSLDVRVKTYSMFP